MLEDNYLAQCYYSVYLPDLEIFSAALSISSWVREDEMKDMVDLDMDDADCMDMAFVNAEDAVSSWE